MDVIEIDGASNRGIEEIRELRENVRYTPAKSRYKIYIIDEVHMLTREAFNALLKTLEEPPRHIIFIFATTEPHKIPATILSRCQRYDFKRISIREMTENLKQITEREGIRISERGLLLISRESEGSMRDAQSLLDQVISYGGKEIRDEDIIEVLGLIDQKILYDTVEAIATKDAQRCMEIVNHLYHYGHDIQHFCQDLLNYLRNLILIKVSQHPEGLIEIPQEEFERLRGQAERFRFEELDYLFTLLLKGEEEMAQSAFPRTMLEIVLIRMATLRPVLSIDTLLKKLEEMEKTSSPHDVEKTTGIPQVQTRRETKSHSTREVFSSKNRGEKTANENVPSDHTLSNVSPSPKDLSKHSGRKVEAYREERTLEEWKEFSEEMWRGLVDFIRARNPILGSFLFFGSPIRISDREVEIGFEKDSFHYDRILEKGNRNLLESLCEEYFKKKTRVIIIPVERGARFEASFANPIRGDRDHQEEGNNHKVNGETLIEETLRLFDGKIVKT